MRDTKIGRNAFHGRAWIFQVGVVVAGFIVCAAAFWGLYRSVGHTPGPDSPPPAPSAGHAGQAPGSGYIYYQSLTGDDATSDKSRWDSVYRKNKGYLYGKEPAPFLVENFGLLPVGRALDIAMGEGRNAVFLAKKGFDVIGVDISEVAIRKARRLARENNVRIHTVTADLNSYPVQPESYDAILVFYYLQRSLVPQIIRGLKPGGVLMFEAYNVGQAKYEKGMNAAYMLAKGELKSMFRGLSILKYEETDNGKTSISSLVAQKPARR